MPKSIDELLIKINGNNKRTFEVSNWFKDTLNAKSKQLEMAPNLDKLIDKRKYIISANIPKIKKSNIIKENPKKYFYQNIGDYINDGLDEISYFKNNYLFKEFEHDKNKESRLAKINKTLGNIKEKYPSDFTQRFTKEVKKRNQDERDKDDTSLSIEEARDAVNKYKDKTMYKYPNLVNAGYAVTAYGLKSNVPIVTAFKLNELMDYTDVIKEAQRLKRLRRYTFNTKDLF